MRGMGSSTAEDIRTRPPGPAALVVVAVALHLGGAAALAGLAWGRLDPSAAPWPPLLVLLVLAVALADFAFAAGYALGPSRREDMWRPVLVAALAAGGAVAALSARSPHPLAGLGAAVVLALAARAAETLGKQLAPTLRRAGDYGAGEWPRQAPETRRVVLETWVGVAAAAAALRLGPAAVPGLAATLAGGLVLAAVAKLDSAERLARLQGFVWAPADRMRAWRGAATVMAATLAVALILPGLPPVLSRRFLFAPLRFLFWAAGLMGPGGSGPAGHTAPQPHRPLALGSVPVGTTGFGGGTSTIGHALGGSYVGLTLLGNGQNLLLALVALGIVVTVAVAYLRYVFDPEVGGWRQALVRLWEALWSWLAFWRWLRGWRLGREPRLPRSGTPDRSGPGRTPAAGTGGLPWGLGDPRRRIRAAFRRYLRQVAAAGMPRRPQETPAVLLRRIEPQLPSAAAEATLLTHAYEEARFSDHAIPRPWAARAVEAARRTLAALRGLARRPG
jgi:hypothetical protein